MTAISNEGLKVLKTSSNNSCIQPVIFGFCPEPVFLKPLRFLNNTQTGALKIQMFFPKTIQPLVT